MPTEKKNNKEEETDVRILKHPHHGIFIGFENDYSDVDHDVDNGFVVDSTGVKHESRGEDSNEN